MNKPKVDEYRIDVVDRLARIESTLSSVHKEARDTKLEIQMQNGRVRKLEGGMAAIQGIGSVISIVFGGFIAYLFKGRM
jgi:cell division ATPase FtsA